ncbi:MAG: DUF3566 domain-containing protein [Acidimicrobiales bacterium]
MSTREASVRVERRPTVLFDDQVHPNGPRAVEVRLVRRVVRRVDPWSLARFAVLLYSCALIIGMVAFIGVWLVATGTGSIPSIENFITQLFALKKFHFQSLQLLLGTLAVGVIGVFVATLMTVVGGVLYNLISDVVGGVELTVLEEEPLEVVP